MSLPWHEVEEARIADAYQTIFQAAPSPLALVGPGRAGPRIIRANAAFEEAFGPRGGVLEGRRIDRVFRGAASQQVAEAVERCLLEGVVVRLRIADAPAGEVIRIEVQVRPVTFAEGRHAIISTTELRAPGSLSELGEEGVLAELGSLSRGLVYIHDVVGDRLRYSGHPLGGALGLPKAGMVDLKAVRGLVHPQDVRRWRRYARMQLAAPDGEVAHDTFRLRAADGEWLYVNVRTRVFARDSEGRARRIMGVATNVTARYRHAADMAEVAQALAGAEQNERRRIGRELHDATSQFLVAARLSLGAAKRRLGPDDESLALLEDARMSIGRAEREIRSLTYLLHPPWLEQDGLCKALSELAEGFAGRTGLAITVKAPERLPGLPLAAELSLFRVAQEALMNAYRHAQATKVEVRLGRVGHAYALEIEDDGRGMSLGPDALMGGVGIPGMKARMGQLGGSLSLEPGAKGLKVRALAPLELRP